MGKLVFPADYPWKPPSIIMLTETGRFRISKRLCLSISDYHPEQWNPLWTVDTIIIGLVSFMTTEKNTLGSIEDSAENREKIAKKSIDIL